MPCPRPSRALSMSSTVRFAKGYHGSFLLDLSVAGLVILALLGTVFVAWVVP